MKRAEGYERSNDWYFYPSSRTMTGLWVASAPIIHLNKHELPQRKSDVLMEALNGSLESVPLPDANDNLLAPILKMSGVKSWSTFARHSKCIAVKLMDGELTIIPHRKLGSKGAFQTISEKTIRMPSNSAPEDIGMALEEAFALCSD